MTDTALQDAARLADAVRSGDRRALARAITLIESTRADHRETAEALLAALLPYTGNSVRLGISGVPGVGKSTFIEAFGLHVIGLGHKVAVLAVDPSSQRTGGSILGDKTRMVDLSREANAFIRPSPAGTTLGGVARRTREAMLICEAAGFDVIVVETVGVGQSETAVADMVDLFMLLLLPAGGDELQGIKKGIVELADLVVVNKADGDLAATARHTVADYRHALALLRHGDWRVPVLSCSAFRKIGIDTVWQTIGEHKALTEANGARATRRAEQARAWLWSEIRETLIDRFRSHPAVRADLARLEAEVTAGTTIPAAAAHTLLGRFLAQSDRA
ncbi:methylmalonyl Co-A mutase-associated GTPase MeaB [Azospirillum oryzae]|uniref:Methylmalonyl Co-A mutase-associated GTPase MeaB n=1 Tax=Azospirillum oryzae TaxID=286727 RepID=A0A6N1ANE6_9PROT|nr:methylmalonyl Co-A mutase-associated GTPase MeaB [Azospirillum oryzae]KAA0590588.1 methylmalonyl Co-A mutase-associated GTPase MeaB [Azospirillum oryzae]QKS52953.1 methylmalonyl Co-A mutase-associated GTPase MeaB [Azospirillum oryzae]GLR80101.1 LAO/AO transport system kinase [Azospirillum oryzae]